MFSHLLKSDHAHLDAKDVLAGPTSCLIGVNDEVEDLLLDALGIASVFDLAASRVFGEARQLMTTATDANGSGKRSLEQTALRPLDSLDSIGKPAAARLAEGLKLSTIYELATWTPYLAAKEILDSVITPTPQQLSELESPAYLIPRAGKSPTERAFYTQVYLDQTLDALDDLEDLETAGQISILPSRKQIGYTKPATGVILTASQSWYPKGVALGQLLHSVALSPGESTRIAVVDWSRRSRAGMTEEVGQRESLTAETGQNRSVSEVTGAVARETQHGFSGMLSTAGSAQMGYSSGALFGGVSTGYSQNWAAATNVTRTEGERNLSAEMAQNIANRTQQASSSARTRRASVVREALQSEHEELSTRVITNYNHMHALSVQYYEVVQIYEVVTGVSKCERCLFIPMKAMNFFDARLIDYYQPVLLKAALSDDVRQMLKGWTGQCQANFAPFSSLSSRIQEMQSVKIQCADKVDAATRPIQHIVGTIPGLRNFPPERFVACLKANSVLPIDLSRYIRFFDQSIRARDNERLQYKNDAEKASRVLERNVASILEAPIDLPGTVELSSIECTGSYTRSQADNLFWEEAPITGFKFLFTLPDGGEEARDFVDGKAVIEKPIIELSSVSIQVSSEGGEPDQKPGERDIRLVLRFSYRGNSFDLTHGVRLAGGSEKLLIFDVIPPHSTESLIEHLNENALYYSQAIWMGLDPQVLTQLIAGYKYNEQKIGQQVDPMPVAVTGNYLGFRWHSQNEKEREEFEEEFLQQHESQQEIIPLPSGGMFAEAVLGQFNAAEKLDMSRFWNWTDSPIPILPPEIQPLAAGSRAQPEGVAPGELAPPVATIQAPQALPDPMGMSKLIDALMQSDIFRDMSGQAALAGIIQKGLEESGQSAQSAAEQAKETMKIAGEQRLKALEKILPILTSVIAPGSGSISAIGAALNATQSLAPSKPGKPESAPSRKKPSHGKSPAIAAE